MPRIRWKDPVQLEVAALLQALRERLLDDGSRGRTTDGFREGVYLGGQRVIGWKRRGVDEKRLISASER
jgi:hypothetical protein